jgi:hypothetical protein
VLREAGGGVGVESFSRLKDLGFFVDLAGTFLGEFAKVDGESTRWIFPFYFSPTSALEHSRDNKFQLYI